MRQYIYWGEVMPSTVSFLSCPAATLSQAVCKGAVILGYCKGTIPTVSLSLAFTAAGSFQHWGFLKKISVCIFLPSAAALKPKNPNSSKICRVNLIQSACSVFPQLDNGPVFISTYTILRRKYCCILRGKKMAFNEILSFLLGTVKRHLRKGMR